jgi:hypothetical protein
MVPDMLVDATLAQEPRALCKSREQLVIMERRMTIYRSQVRQFIVQLHDAATTTSTTATTGAIISTTEFA